MLSRKTNRQDKIHDVLVRLICQSNYVTFLQSKSIEMVHIDKVHTDNEILVLNLIKDYLF